MLFMQSFKHYLKQIIQWGTKARGRTAPDRAKQQSAQQADRVGKMHLGSEQRKAEQGPSFRLANK